ncbi:FAD-binding oxidoreductase [Actinomarinicola tropica]|uniref:FAD-binding protein n=1 Tax=Actinomarinicola tropica TaxID=2789776 RepID=A0A5Q2RIG9_9ACTN|nr:FAD-binding oxidoreductase [Actinomarinicola tropica]QGG95593.1 FAD-binding protein [Actinomarinicola tropica]
MTELRRPAPLPPTGPGAPTPPIALPDAGSARSLGAAEVPVPDGFVERLGATGAEVSIDEAERAEASRDWWPLGMIQALDNRLVGRAGVVVRPATVDQVPELLALCHEARVPVTPVAGRSGVCGASVPVHGGVALDLTLLSGIRSVDDEGLVLDALPGTFGDHLEAELRGSHGLTLGHWPQSVALSTVGGWLACRSAGQLSNRYGKIEDLVVGLDVALADGRVVRTGAPARSAVGPDLTQVFVGSEGTLGVITGARLAVRPAPEVEAQAAYGFASWDEGMDACRRVLRRGGDAAVLRLYDEVESDRSYQTGDLHVLLVLDEGDPVTVQANMEIVDQECRGAARLDDALVERWLGHRNEVGQLESLVRNGFVVDTMEISAGWSALPGIYRAAVEALRAVPGVRAASAHQSHAYVDGACLYFTFAGRPPGEGDERDHEAMYRACWEAGTRAVLEHGGSLSHHHGVGLNRSRFVDDALGSGTEVLHALKAALDPHGILNPGKLGLPDPFGEVGWP